MIRCCAAVFMSYLLGTGTIFFFFFNVSGCVVCLFVRYLFMNRDISPPPISPIFYHSSFFFFFVEWGLRFDGWQSALCIKPRCPCSSFLTCVRACNCKLRVVVFRRFRGRKRRNTIPAYPKVYMMPGREGVEVLYCRSQYSGGGGILNSAVLTTGVSEISTDIARDGRMACSRLFDRTKILYLLTWCVWSVLSCNYQQITHRRAFCFL